MIAIILATHGKVSEEILKLTESILGKQRNVATITYLPGEGADDLMKKYEDVIKSLRCQAGVLFMVDLFGGSPFNAASRIAAKGKNMDIITGANIPMLLGVFSAREDSTVDELAAIAISTGQLGIKSLKETLKNSKENE
ncbi:mannose/fructose/sorbose PTS transporter subunit IIA [Clostridium estertheticum]|uniref:PTS mannose transporter subunit IID n=1 Tax=Clostridium estertheticum subsp. estertheticum TaxID=1552 RepID=A0A1J0GEN4_9CLOT|nr:mannose/fructose/sorbose PTS transporter subunit IIA [Clostridium estertheticum]APC39755.1 PTS mannose transporter subunit IID [Clostridium estertheticum subsp. estertheticum]MBU3172085.1 mannose/fructose/sorbose PTS transporter subunit IIA [Clostridium estertheticum]MBZ9614199.1 mannose/fructose/sorbose PTS transporter subunit IIA [Clostridium estertheticum subsp. laramiense]MCB2340032.1 mannose/fructose/sorbose PTS transporter subunit IIA [Clostridium estertheticum]WAG74144.1 mannose/fruc